MPGMGTNSAAAVAGAIRVSFPNIKSALVVGVCGGLPYGPDQEEIVLHDSLTPKVLALHSESYFTNLITLTTATCRRHAVLMHI
jgi:nucleoside phosphorylase